MDFRPAVYFFGRFGNKPVFRVLIFLAAANSFAYVFMRPGLYWWVWIEAVTSGAMWAGAIVGTTNFIIRLTPEGARDRYVAAYAVVAGACGLVSTIGSGHFVAALPRYVAVGGWQVLNVKIAFVLTTALRLSAQIPLTRVREPRAVRFRVMMRTVAGEARLWLLRLRPGLGK